MRTHLPFSLPFVILRLEHLEEEIIEHGASLIVVDSIASLIRKEFDSRSGRNMTERANVLVRQAAQLKYLAETFHIPVSMACVYV